MGGFFGCAFKRSCNKELFYGTDYLSHLGTKRGGMATVDKKEFQRTIHNLENAYFRSKFESDIDKLTGNMGIGVISDTDSQPIIIHSHLGKFAVVTVGRISNLDELAQQAFLQNIHFAETSQGDINPTELVAILISQKESFEEGIANAQSKIKGSCSMLILTDSGIYAARDKLGRTPIVIGKGEDAYAASSESSAFSNLGFEVEHYVGPNEIIKITPEGIEQVQPPGKEMQVCSFLWVYYGYPASSYEGINTEKVRYNCGAALAKRETENVDLVAGIPDSGIGHAIGFANASKVPFMRPYVKYTPTWPRSFMPQNQDMRDLVARMKLIPVRELIEGKRIIFCDDSVVRGTQLKENTQILYEYGAKEVHMRVACPSLIHPCEFLNFSTSRSTLDLAGRKAIYDIEGTEDIDLTDYAVDGSEKHSAMIGRIIDRLNLSSIRFQKLDDLVAAIGLPKNKLCTHCWDGSSHF
ncbi:amidophosphoribosyltransferase [Desulfobacula toluolica]|uniref:Amidophosphoribosyltransferase n=1 Tax=Desulfobacula toluolica (strain DSM 7467 / Tol2) TaxID=651182 RepID=K0N4X5_DESTT|nr:amidophosphoribosyltransferase [Desulfobacula toluolica]CCK79169.1 PurF: amidophosphoribosyltransferase [Desulfobacula toluolica Tol2]